MWSHGTPLWPPHRRSAARVEPTPVLTLGCLELAVQSAGAAAGSLAGARCRGATALVTVQTEAQGRTHRALLQVHTQRAAVVGHTGHEQGAGGALRWGQEGHVRAKALSPDHQPTQLQALPHSHGLQAVPRGAVRPSPCPTCPSSARQADPAPAPASAVPVRRGHTVIKDGPRRKGGHKTA